MAIVKSLARGTGKLAGWTAASLVKAAESTWDQLGESGEDFSDAYETSYETRAAYLDLSPEERKQFNKDQRAAKRAALAAKREPLTTAPTKKLVKA